MMIKSNIIGKDGTEDSLDINDFQFIKLNIEKINYYKGISLRSVEINLSLHYDVDKGVGVLSSKVDIEDSKLSLMEEFDIIEFINQAAEVYYDNKQLENTEELLRCTRSIKSKVCDHIRESLEGIVLDIEQVHPIFILNQNNNVIACVDKYTCSETRYLNFNMEQYYSIDDDLVADENSKMKAKFILKDKTIVMDIVNISFKTNIFSVKINSVSKVNNNEIIELAPLSEFNTKSDYNDNRSQYVELKAENNLNNLFADFDLNDL